MENDSLKGADAVVFSFDENFGGLISTRLGTQQQSYYLAVLYTFG